MHIRNYLFSLLSKQLPAHTRTYTWRTGSNYFNQLLMNLIHQLFIEIDSPMNHRMFEYTNRSSILHHFRCLIVYEATLLFGMRLFEKKTTTFVSKQQ